MTLDSKTMELLSSATARRLDQLVALRRHLHQHPELGLQEQATAALVRDTLAAVGIAPQPALMETDVVALIAGPDGAREPNITLRADMDALPLQEETGRPYASETPGVMHACGHDGHTAALLGAALVLCDCRELLSGSVRLVFQPAEELISGGHRLVQAGVLEDPRPRTVVALHGWPGIPAGRLTSCPGAIMAAAEFFRLHLTGRGGHAAAPHLARDPLAAGAQIVNTLPAVLKQSLDPLDPHVITFCHFSAGSNSNVIPRNACLQGTLRYLTPDVGRSLRERLEKTVDACCRLRGIEYELEYGESIPPTVNDARAVDLGRSVATQLFGKDGWQDLARPSLGGEDFCFFLEEAPGAMFRLGMGNDSAPLHSPLFDFNDEALGPAVRFLCGMALAGA